MTEQSVFNFVKNIMPKMRKSRQKTLSASVQGCLMNPRGKLTDMARGMTSRVQLRDRLKRISRFLGNENIVTKKLGKNIYEWLIRRQGPLIPVVVFMDWTEEHSQSVLVMSMKWGKRAIPFYWHAIESSNLKGKLVDFELKALKWLRSSSGDRQVVVIADRGFERQKFYKELKMQNLDFIVRSKSTTCFFEKNKKYQLREMKLIGTKIREFKEVLFSKRMKLSLRIVAKKIKVKGQWSHWYLTTSLKTETAQQIISLYERRMGIEASFKDMKTTLGWGKQYHIKDAKRLERYILILVVSIMIAMVVSGWKAAQTNRFKVSLNKAWRGTKPTSFVQLGLWLIQRLPPKKLMLHHRKDWSYAA